jgi:hypothetical protein
MCTVEYQKDYSIDADGNEYKEANTKDSLEIVNVLLQHPRIDVNIKNKASCSLREGEITAC